MKRRDKWDDMDHADRVDVSNRLSMQFNTTLDAQNNRLVWVAGRSKTVTELPEEVAKRHLWDAIRRHGGEPLGWDVEERRAGETLNIINSEGDVFRDTLTKAELICVAPDGNHVRAHEALGYHFDKPKPVVTGNPPPELTREQRAELLQTMIEDRRAEGDKRRKQDQARERRRQRKQERKEMLRLRKAEEKFRDQVDVDEVDELLADIDEMMEKL